MCAATLSSLIALFSSPAMSCLIGISGSAAGLDTVTVLISTSPSGALVGPALGERACLLASGASDGVPALLLEEEPLHQESGTQRGSSEGRQSKLQVDRLV